MQKPLKTPRTGLQRPVRRRRLLEKKNKANMEVENLKLYMENNRIMQENEKLKSKALLLHRENQELLSQLQNWSSPSTHFDLLSNHCMNLIN